MAPFGPPKSIAPTRSPFLECLENWKYYYYYYSKLLILFIFFLSNSVPKTRSSSNPIFTQSSPHPPPNPPHHHPSCHQQGLTQDCYRKKQVNALVLSGFNVIMALLGQ
jgi:hypothetical protein